MTLRQQIEELRQDGKTYNQIKSELGCSTGTISYHLKPEQKEKTLARQRKRRKVVHPYKIKLERFINPTKKPTTNKQTHKWKSLIRDKIKRFSTTKGIKQVELKFTTEDIINKFGENPKCYITGDDIDIYSPRTYNFDHIIPRSRGGDNTIDNLGICTKQANQAKHDMTPEELIEFCKKVLEHNNLP